MLGAEAAFSGRFFGQGPMSEIEQTGLPSGVIAVVKRGCPTCALVEPVLESLDRSLSLTVYCQDDPAFLRQGQVWPMKVEKCQDSRKGVDLLLKQPRSGRSKVSEDHVSSSSTN